MTSTVFIGSYSGDRGPGGIRLGRLDPVAGQLDILGRADREIEAGYLVYAPGTRMLYAVDERKTDGRGPVGAPAAIHAFRVDAKAGRLTWQGMQAVLGPFPTYLDLHPREAVLASASHGSFEHVEHVVQHADGSWGVDYLYDHSTVALHRLGPDGAPEGIADLHRLEGHGLDPNDSLQAGGHAQASAHAHCATFDRSGRWLIVCDKGTDRILSFRCEGGRLDLARTFTFPPETAPRHVAFSQDGRRMFLTLELASAVASMAFDPDTGEFNLLDRQQATAGGHDGPNEPAEIRLHPQGHTLYLNNRGEDALAWFSIDADGGLSRQGQVPLAKSIHPGLAARSFAFDPAGGLLLAADRPAHAVRIYRADGRTGALVQTGKVDVPDPVFVAFADAPPNNPQPTPDD